MASKQFLFRRVTAGDSAESETIVWRAVGLDRRTLRGDGGPSTIPVKLSRVRGVFNAKAAKKGIEVRKEDGGYCINEHLTGIFCVLFYPSRPLR
jgi:hypothetical protein